ncbi:MAG: riboflavin synthase [Azospirillaceae bacterium]
MFTGLITDVGRVAEVEPGGVTRMVVETGWDTAELEIGASVAHSGCCLTVVAIEPGRFAVEVSAETLARTTLGDWRPGTRVNLERSLKVGDEIGGHFVAGHVDAVIDVVDAWPDGDSTRFVFEVPPALAGFVAPKGSVALDGVSLTVNEVETGAGGSARFGVNIIPHTRAWTTFADIEAGHRVNFEADLLARYVGRIVATGPEAGR